MTRLKGILGPKSMKITKEKHDRYIKVWKKEIKGGQSSYSDELAASATRRQ
jgi:hypothetical protein